MGIPKGTKKDHEPIANLKPSRQSSQSSSGLSAWLALQPHVHSLMLLSLHSDCQHAAGITFKTLVLFMKCAVSNLSSNSVVLSWWHLSSQPWKVGTAAALLKQVSRQLGLQSKVLSLKKQEREAVSSWPCRVFRVDQQVTSHTHLSECLATAWWFSASFP